MVKYGQMLYNGDVIEIQKNEASIYFKQPANKWHINGVLKYSEILMKKEVEETDATETARYIKYSAYLGEMYSMLKKQNGQKHSLSVDNLYVNGSEFKISNVQEERYVAKYGEQAWHTDLHFLGKICRWALSSIVSVSIHIDDRTRKVMYYEVLPDKTMKSTSSALENAFSKFNSPKTVIRDNG